MREIKEKTGYFGNAYEILLDDVLVGEVKIVRVSKKYENFHYVFLFDSEGKVIQKVYDFLNDECKGETLSGREQAANALKLLYSFSEIIGRDVQKFNKTDINNLSNFFQGINIEGNIERYIFKTSRSITTHNIYFDIIRKYLRYSNINNDIFFRKKVVRKQHGGYGMMAHTRTVITEKYETNKARDGSFTNCIPKYISLEEYHKIINYIKNSDSQFKLRNILIIDLMYRRGLRLGEVLGITLEDITPHPNNPKAGLLYLRNRVSDKKYQRAKTCTNVLSTEGFKLDGGKKDKCQKIDLPQELMKQIKEYINESRENVFLSDRRIENLMNFAKADNVTDNRGENFYLFLNKNGMPLSSSGWNKILKNIFVNVGIRIDKNKKRNNLSHRFRHGYAMFLIEVMGKEKSEVQSELRHRSIDSTGKYINPKPKKVLEESEKIQEKFMSELKKIARE